MSLWSVFNVVKSVCALVWSGAASTPIRPPSVRQVVYVSACANWLAIARIAARKKALI